MQLYEDDNPGQLFTAHVDACCGALNTLTANQKVRASAVVYALCDRSAMGTWPAMTHDRTASQMVLAGEPFCSVHASGDDIETTLIQLQFNIQQIQEKYNECQNHIKTEH